MLQIARILKSNGTDGGVLVGFSGCGIEDLDLEEPVYIEFDGLPVPFFIESVQSKSATKAVLHITGVCSLEDSEEIVGRDVFMDGEWEDEDEDNFIGWSVWNRSVEVGEVVDMEAIPGNPCLDVKTSGGEVVIVPLHEDLVISIDEGRRILDLDLPDGLV